MQNQGSVLLKTSAASDVVCSGGQVTIAGLPGIPKNRISSIVQVRSKAETVQVVTVGDSSYTPTASTKYIVLIGQNKLVDGAPSKLKAYTYTTPETLTEIGANDAAQREAIHVALVAAINDDTSQPVAAATLGTGSGFTITDDAGYYPAFSHTGTGRLGASKVETAKDPNGGGFVSDADVTTAAVYASGVGATLAAMVPVIDSATGGLISGYLSTSLAGWGFATKPDNDPAVTGQQYDIFVINALQEVSAYGGSGVNKAYTPTMYAVAVDNGKGSSTTNASGFAAFERAMQKVMFSLYGGDPQSTIQFFESAPTFASSVVASTGLPAVTGVPTGATGDENVLRNDEGSLVYHILGAGQTKIVPTWTADGLTLDLDAADDEGAEYSASIMSASPKQFVVGKDTATLIVKGKIADVSDTDDCAFGFRKKEAYQANIDDYDEMACLNVIAGDIKIETILNGDTTTTTDTTVNWADTEEHELMVKVGIDGVCKFYVDGVDKTGVLSADFTFDAGETLIPFAFCLNAAASAPDVEVSKFVAVASDAVIV